MLTGHLLYTNTRHYLFFVVISFIERAKLSPIEIQIREKKCLMDSLTTLKDWATQLLIKYKSGALATKLPVNSLGCTGQVLFTSLNFLREVWFLVRGYKAQVEPIRARPVVDLVPSEH